MATISHLISIMVLIFQELRNVKIYSRLKYQKSDAFAVNMFKQIVVVLVIIRSKLSTDHYRFDAGIV